MIREISSRDNPKIKNMIKLCSDKKYRQAEKIFVCESAVMLAEAQKSGVKILQIYALAGYEALLHSVNCTDKYIVPEKLIEQMSDVKNPQGVVFSCKMPDVRKTLLNGCIIALENIRDSGNLGTIIRSAEGFGIGTVALVGECAEVYNPKTIRASMGSVFRQNIVQCSVRELMEYARENGITVCATALSNDAKDVREINLKNSIVIIGNEANGISEDLLTQCTQHVIIPIKSAQSFNASVAAAVIMWEMVR